MRSKTLAEGMWADAFVDFCCECGSFDCFLDDGFVQMVAAGKAGFQVNIKAGSWENGLPNPLFVGDRVFSVEGAGQQLGYPAGW